MYRKGVLGIVINKKREFLILYRKLHWRGWEFPKGGLSKGETEEQALKRELKEETGLDVNIVTRLPHKVVYYYPPEFIGKTGTKYSGAKQVVYLVLADGKVKLSEEHAKYRWVSYKDARKLLRHETQKKALDIAYQCAI